MKGHTVQVVYS